MNLMKAFDSVDWDFLLEMTRVMELPSQLIQWFHTRITWSYVLSGNQWGASGDFSRGKSTEVGAPSVSIPFHVTMEGFTSLLHYMIGQNEDFVLHPKFRSLNYHHLTEKLHLLLRG